METIIFGILVSVAAEVVTWLNKVLTGTVLAGKGSFILAFAVAVTGATVKVVWFDGGAVITWATLWATITQIWVVSQVFFMFVVEWLKLDVKPDNA